MKTKVLTNKRENLKISIDWIRHSHACSTAIIEDAARIGLLWEKPIHLTNRGMSMAQYSGNCLKQRIQSYDFCISSFIPRAVETALLMFDNSKKTLYLSPYIHEFRNPFALGFDTYNTSPYKTITDLKKFVDAFKKSHNINLKVSYKLMNDNHLNEVTDIHTWLNVILPKILKIKRKNQLSLKFGAVCHGLYIRSIIKAWQYDLGKILEEPQELKKKGCTNNHNKISKHNIPNTSAWNQVLEQNIKTKIIQSKKFKKYYVPPVDKRPFFSQKYNQRKYTEDDIESCNYKQFTKWLIL